MKRDLVHEILAKRARRRGGRWRLFSDRVAGLYQAIDLLREYDGDDQIARYELLKYIAVALVAALEGYYRAVIRDLINHGGPYRVNAHKLTDLRLDVGTIVQLQQERVTAGEFIAHLVPLSSLADINKAMSTLLGVDYFGLLKTTPWNPPGAQTYEQANPRAWQDLEALYSDRHITCHELAPRVPVTFKRTVRHWRAVMLLALADDVVINPRLR